VSGGDDDETRRSGASDADADAGARASSPAVRQLLFSSDRPRDEGVARGRQRWMQRSHSCADARAIGGEKNKEQGAREREKPSPSLSKAPKRTHVLHHLGRDLVHQLRLGLLDVLLLMLVVSWVRGGEGKEERRVRTRRKTPPSFDLICARPSPPACLCHVPWTWLRGRAGAAGEAGEAGALVRPPPRRQQRATTRGSSPRPRQQKGKKAWARGRRRRCRVGALRRRAR
jgi:hypothetical protein